MVHSYIYLGVLIDDGLTFKGVPKGKINARIYQLGKMRKYITSDIACLIYKQTILPLSDYADLVVGLGPPDKISRLQKMQDRAVRIIDDGMHRNLDVDVIANLFSLTPLKLRRAEHLSLIMFRLKSHQTLIHQARPKIHLRGRNKIKFKSYKRQNERFLRSPISRGFTMWDRIPEQVQRSTTKVKFRRDIKPYLTDLVKPELR